MKWIAALILIVMASVAQAQPCVSWRTVTETDRWGNSWTYTQCIEYAQPRHHIHHHHYSPNRSSDILLGVVIGAGTYHVLDRDRRHHRRGSGPARHCWQDRRGMWRCRN